MAKDDQKLSSTESRRMFFWVQVLTLVRVPLGLAFAVVLLYTEYSVGTLTLWLSILVLIELTDLLDGLSARRGGVVSEWGAMLDPYADSVTRLIVYWALACKGYALVLLPLVMALRDVTVAYCRIVLVRSGRTVSARWSGKIKAVVQGVGAFILAAGPAYWGYTGRWTIETGSWIVIVVTVISVVEYAAAALEASRAGKN